MAGETVLTFDQLPKVAPYYVKAATTLSGGLSRGGTIPRITARIDNLKIRSEHLARYRKVCGFVRAGHLPITYPHVLAFPLHMAVLTHADFPLKLLGLVHVHNEITQERRIGVEEALDLVVFVEGHRETSKGIEFDLVTEARDPQGSCVWHASATMLSRQQTSIKKDPSHERKGPPTLDFEPTDQDSWSIPGDQGRRYAAAAGDYNPIHLSALSARLFGFKRAIAHGMWTKARAAAALSDRIADQKCTLAVTFKKPVFLPSETMFRYKGDDDGVSFALTNESGEIHHLTGTLAFV
ncbi:MaoC/PaaZ C-terminal domain-containing protein [Salinisphaera sp. Q1T1-3]|uniref:MaoC family dehydratase n=1 Tax=Salinisphaera sp. Q1T1-3 TaxID=2321229 RepID=UPI000E71B2DC|nr:MaoC/PaaZ C-terminal domain-containing protein [Salinisphaera sp. Q1T1-3]RJS95272.1 hypothetical protein D3260_01595 [Salinisphaera sp. Q1T1-3]